MKVNEKNIDEDYNDIGVCLLAYNRPHHLKKTLDGLKLNRVKKIYIFCDNSSILDKDNLIKIKEVHKILDEIDWCEKIIIKHDKNLGVRKSSLFAKKYMFERYEKIIYLEDDCVPTNGFINFLKFCLKKYEHNAQVKSVTGYCPPIKIPNEYKYDLFFTYRHCPWGFGTWKRVWLEFCENNFNHSEIFNSKNNKNILKKAGNDLLPMIINDYFHLSDSIGIRWAWNSLKKNGININPVKSFIKNEGHDGSGSHSYNIRKYDVDYYNSNEDLNFPNKAIINDDLNSQMVKFHSVSNITYKIYDLTPNKILYFIIKLNFFLKKIFKKIEINDQ